MFIRFAAGMTYSASFYALTAAVVSFCAIEPFLLKKLSDVEEHAGKNGPALSRVIGRPIVYACGLLLFMVFDTHDGQFIYTQF
jgi:hypothetical protein